MSKKIIAVMGATGEQGGGLVRALLSDPDKEFAVRALTRQPNSEPARLLAKRGAEVVEADMENLDSLRAAFTGAHGVFCVTSFWAQASLERESEQIQTMARAAHEARVRHVVWSTQEDTRLRVPLDNPDLPTLKARYKVPQFDVKGAGNGYFTQLEVPTTFLLTPFSWRDQLLFGLSDRPDAQGRYVFVLPMGDKRLPGIAMEDVGGCVLGIFKRGEALVGRTVGLAGDQLTGAQLAATLGEVLGRDVVYENLPPEVYRTFKLPGAEDLANMFQYMRDFEPEYCASRDPVFSRELNPALQTFAQWLTRHKAHFLRPC